MKVKFGEFNNANLVTVELSLSYKELSRANKHSPESLRVTATKGEKEVTVYTLRDSKATELGETMTCFPFKSNKEKIRLAFFVDSNSEDAKIAVARFTKNVKTIIKQINTVNKEIDAEIATVEEME